jgi:hypothetical protein
MVTPVIEQVKVDVEVDLPGVQCCLADSPSLEAEGTDTVDSTAEESTATVEAVPMGQFLIKHLRLRMQLAGAAAELKASVGTMIVQDCDPASPFPLVLTPLSLDTASDGGSGAWLMQQEAQPMLSMQVQLSPHATSTLMDDISVEVTKAIDLRLSFNFALGLAQRMDAMAAVFRGGHTHGSARPADSAAVLATFMALRAAVGGGLKPLHIRSLSIPNLHLALQFNFDGRTEGVGDVFGGATEDGPYRSRGASNAGAGGGVGGDDGADDMTIDLDDVDVEAEGSGSDQDSPASMTRSMSATELSKKADMQAKQSLAFARSTLECAEISREQTAAHARAQHAATGMGAGDSDSDGLSWYEDHLMQSMRAVLSHSASPSLAKAVLHGGISVSVGPVAIAGGEGAMASVQSDVTTRLGTTLALRPLSELGVGTDDGSDGAAGGSGGAQRTAAALSSIATAAARSGADAVGDLMQLTSKEVRKSRCTIRDTSFACLLATVQHVATRHDPRIVYTPNRTLAISVCC